MFDDTKGNQRPYIKDGQTIQWGKKLIKKFKNSITRLEQFIVNLEYIALFF